MSPSPECPSLDIARQQRQVLVLAQVPPPLHGVTAMTERVLCELKALPDATVTQAWSGSASRLDDVDGKSFWKLLGFAGLNLKLARMALFEPKCDVVYLTFAPWAHTAIRDAIIAWWARQLANRALVHLHGEGLAAAIEGDSLKAVAMRYLLRGTELIAITSSAAEIGRQSGLFNRVSHLSNCAPDPGQPHGRGGALVRFGFLGNLDPRKGVLGFVDILERLTAAGWPVDGAIAGGSTRYMSTEQLAAEIAGRGLANRISVLGPLQGDTKDRFFAGLDVFLYLSEHDHAPLVVIEAMSHGALPIVLDTGGIPEIMGPALAHLVLSRDLSATERTTAVMQLLDRYRAEPGAIDTDREAVRNRYLSEFSEPRFRDRLRAILALPPQERPAKSPTEDVRSAAPRALKQGVISLVRVGHHRLAGRALPTRIALYFHALEGPDRKALTDAVGTLREHGYRYVSLDTYLDAATNGKIFTVSFDDNYASWHDSLSLLADLEIKATFFTNSLPFRDACSVAEIDDYRGRIGASPDCLPLSRAELRALAEAGHEIGCHTHSHFLLARLDQTRWEREIRGSRLILEDIAGRPVRHFSWPYGMPRHITEEQKDYCLSVGFESIAAATPGMLHAGIGDRRSVPRSEWRTTRSIADNLIDLAIDGRVFTRLTGRSAIG